MEKILPTQQRWLTGDAKFSYYPLGKIFEMQPRAIEKDDEKQAEALKSSKSSSKKSLSVKFFISEGMVNPEIINKIENMR